MGYRHGCCFWLGCSIWHPKQSSFHSVCMVWFTKCITTIFTRLENSPESIGACWESLSELDLSNFLFFSFRSVEILGMVLRMQSHCLFLSQGNPPTSFLCLIHCSHSSRILHTPALSSSEAAVMVVGGSTVPRQHSHRGTVCRKHKHPQSHSRSEGKAGWWYAQWWHKTLINTMSVLSRLAQTRFLGARHSEVPAVRGSREGVCVAASKHSLLAYGRCFLGAQQALGLAGHGSRGGDAAVSVEMTWGSCVSWVSSMMLNRWSNGRKVTIII